jgi:hypothetical protein
MERVADIAVNVPPPFPTDSQADRNDGGEPNEQENCGFPSNIHGSILSERIRPKQHGFGLPFTQES